MAKFKFAYKKQTAGQVEKRLSEKGGTYDSIIKSEFKVYKMKDGLNKIRIIPCPVTLEEEEHYAKTIFVNNGIGPDNAQYLSLSQHLKKPDPIAEERTLASREGREEDAKKLRPTKRALMYVIDRKDEASGVQVMNTPLTLDQDILRASKDEGGGVLDIVDPENGFDIIFEKTGTGLTTKYTAVKAARKESPLSDDEATSDEWLKYVTENPLKDCLQFYSYDHIKNVFSGAKSAKKKDEDSDSEDAAPPTRKSSRTVVDDDADDAEPIKPKKRVSLDSDDDGDDISPPAKAVKKPARQEIDPDIDSEDVEPVKAKIKPAKRVVDIDDSDELDSIPEDDEIPPAKPAKKRPPVEDADDEEPAPVKKKPIAKRPADEDFDLDDD